MTIETSKYTLALAALAVGSGAALACAVLGVRRRDQLTYDEADQGQVRQELLEFENKLYLMDVPPVTTLTWFRGDYRKAGKLLEERLQKILEASPWLGGHVGLSRGKLCLVYNRNSNKFLLAKDFTVVLDSTSSTISRRTPVDQMMAKCRHLLLKNGVDQPLINVTLLPCKDSSDTHFALIVSVSHFVADGHTYYSLLSQLCSRSPKNIQALTAVPITSTVEQQKEAMGRENYDAFSIGPRTYLNIVWQVITIMIGLRPLPEGVFVEIDPARIKVAKQMAVSDANDSNCKFVSTNDVLTSWYFETMACTVGCMLINWRNRLEGHTDRHAGNYEYVIMHTKQDWATPALIRASLNNNNFCRAVTTQEPLPKYLKTMAFSTNWSTFARPNEIEGCQEELHIPLMEAILPFMIIFRAGPGRLGLLFLGVSPNKKDVLQSAPFLLEEPLM